MSVKWPPLESNPDSYNNWSRSLGLDTSKWSWQDVWGLDPELLQFVKRPVKAVMVLFPITEPYERKRLEEDEKIAKDGVQGVEDIIYFKQTIGNACGTYALLHALGNAGIPLSDGPLKDVYEQCPGKTPRERSDLLVQSEDLKTVHNETASSGQTAELSSDAVVDHHFASFVDHNGYLIELDGRRESPVNLGKIKVGLLEDAVERVKEWINISNSIEFNVVTLSPTPEEQE